MKFKFNWKKLKDEVGETIILRVDKGKDYKIIPQFIDVKDLKNITKTNRIEMKIGKLLDIASKGIGCVAYCFGCKREVKSGDDINNWKWTIFKVEGEENPRIGFRCNGCIKNHQ